MANIDIRQVRMFVAVADALSFTRAAETLNVAQPWLSVQIRKLEDQIGFQLFFRNRNRGVVLTRQGKVFLEPARAYVEAAQVAAEAAHDIRGYQAIALKLGAPDFSAEIPARAALLDLFCARYPRMEMEIVNAWSPQLLDALHDHEIDMAFTVGPFERSGFDVLRVAEYRWALLVDRELSEQWGSHVSLDDLRGRKIASFRRNINPAFHDSIAPRLVAHDIELVALQESSMGGIRQHAAKAHVPVLISEWHSQANVASDLRVVPFEDPSFTFALHLARRRNDDRVAVRGLWEIAKAAVAANVDNNFISNAA